MSININVNSMSYNRRSYAERAEDEKRKINRILKVREQSNELAHKLRNKYKTAQQCELQKIQEINRKELGEWKKKSHSQIQAKIDECISKFGDAHIAAVNASCEENEISKEKRDEQELMAAMRGRVAMLQIQRERDKKAEERILKKKRKEQKSVGIQSDFLTENRFSENLAQKNKADKNINVQINIEDDDDEMVFTSKPNLHKHSVNINSKYNPQNYTINSIDSSNNCDSDEIDEVEELEDDNEESQNNESEIAFNQITNLLKQTKPISIEEDERISKISSSESTSSIEIIPAQVVKKSQKKPSPKKKSILKKSANSKPSSPVKKSKTLPVVENRVRYIDYNNKYETTYVPDKDIITRCERPKLNAREEAQVQTDDHMISNKITQDVLKQLTEIRSHEALEKEKIRRDYDRLRLELEELSKQEQEAKARTNIYKNLSRDQLLKKENERQKKMNEATENAMKRNIITCQPVDRNDKSVKLKTNVVNVGAASSNRVEKDEPKKANEELSNIVKVERLKDLLEQINHQKRRILKEIEKSDDVPGPDLEKIMDCLKRLEREKAVLDNENKTDEVTKKQLDELNEREKKVRERELRLENKLRELFKKQKEIPPPVSSSSVSPPESISSTTTVTDDKKIVTPPVEIIIKVQQPKSPRSKRRKTYRCLDTLNREPGKVYPKTPIKKKLQQQHVQTEKLPEKIPQQTQTSPVTSDAPKPILKNSQIKQLSISPQITEKPKEVPLPSQKPPSTVIDHEDFSVSTSYRDLPPQIHMNSVENNRKEKQQKPEHKLNPGLVYYIQRLLSMHKNISNQLNVDVSSITTPGSSTINTTDNISVSSNEIIFDENRMDRLQKFIDDNYSFLSDVNESIDRMQLNHQEDEQLTEKIDAIWCEVLRNNKPSKNPSRSSSQVKKNAAAKKIETKSQMPASEPKTKTSVQTIPSQSSQLSLNNQQQQQQRPQSISIQTSQTSVKNQQRPQSTSSQKSHISSEDIERVTKQLESKMMLNYEEYTENCKRRIAELTQMMDKVRQEKLRLIENSLSSNENNNFTEYKDIAQNNATSSQKESPQSNNNRDDPPSEEINNILKTQTRPFGVSKDSGIASSRPVTSSDFRDSPDVRVTSEENNNLFQPITKDIPKLPRLKVTAIDGETDSVKDVSLIIKQQQEDKKKQQKPPLSIKSFSPQIDKQHEGHELSTIAEIETPTASKVNLVADESVGVEFIHTFPNFEEYANQIDSTFPDMNSLKNALPDMNVKTFVGPQEYDIPELSKDNDDDEVKSTNSSLVDIMEELKKRHLFEKSFDLLYENDGDVNMVESSAVAMRDERTTPTTTHQIVQPTSPKRKQAQSRLNLRTPENTTDANEEAIHTPTKRKQASVNIPELPQSPKSNDTLSGIQEIENDFQNVGMSWAANLLKRTEERQRQGNSSSSSDKKSFRFDVEVEFESSSSSSNGRPLNLKDFLRRELTAKNELLSDDSSLSSRFLRSLLNAASGDTSSSSNLKSDSTQNVKLRTSTPVRMHSDLNMKTGVSSQMFVGAESMSTVTSDKSDKEKSKSH